MAGARRFSACSFDFVGEELFDEEEAPIAHVSGDADQGGGQHGRELRAFAEVEGHDAGEGRGAEFADELDEVEHPRVAVPQLLQERNNATHQAEHKHPGVGKQIIGGGILVVHAALQAGGEPRVVQSRARLGGSRPWHWEFDGTRADRKRDGLFVGGL